MIDDTSYSTYKLCLISRRLQCRPVHVRVLYVYRIINRLVGLESLIVIQLYIAMKTGHAGTTIQS